jgi:TonB family protein
MARSALLIGIAGVTACSNADARRSPAVARRELPDELPALLTTELPFRYPAALYARKVQGNVTLRLLIDRDGHVVTDSTRIEETSGSAQLDSAARAGASELRFVPGKLRGETIPVSILFPVYFRHPEARPLPGDTILHAGKPG